jgi:hypothetical protein
MSRKKYSDEAINELADSVYFKRPQPPTPVSPEPESEQTDIEPNPPLPAPAVVSQAADIRTKEPTNERINDSTSVRTSVRISTKRIKTRYAFEFFQDQLEQLKQFSLDEKLVGEQGNMSAMVRDALDAYITKRNRGR